MSDVRTRLVDALRKHNTTPDCSLCGGFFIDESEWLNHVTDVLLSLPGIAIVPSSLLVNIRELAEAWADPSCGNQILGLLDRAAANAAERQDKPGATAPDYADCSGVCADLGGDQ